MVTSAKRAYNLIKTLFLNNVKQKYFDKMSGWETFKKNVGLFAALAVNRARQKKNSQRRHLAKEN
ncbi:MAG: hypothetical protein LUC27_05780, partial [Lachnospiraceae bacterium]|nr:hypothetical protein [Lachnospiraceae bacterium]